jgi:hypothetical protein
MPRKKPKYGLEKLAEKLKEKPELTREVQEQFTHYLTMYGIKFDGKVHKKDDHYKLMASRQPWRSWGFMSLRLQEFSNCMVQLELEPLPGLKPASVKGVIKRFTWQSLILSVVVNSMLKSGRINEAQATAAGALRILTPKKVTK